MGWAEGVLGEAMGEIGRDLDLERNEVRGDEARGDEGMAPVPGGVDNAGLSDSMGGRKGESGMAPCNLSVGVFGGADIVECG